MWLESYKEEYDGLSNNDTFDSISKEEYIRLCKLHGIKAMPSMCTFTIKRTNGLPTRAKSQIVVLGNFDPRPWTKTDCFSLVVSIPMVQLILLLLSTTNVPLNRAIANSPLSKHPYRLMN
jgi:hypothetical protein